MKTEHFVTLAVIVWLVLALAGCGHASVKPDAGNPLAVTNCPASLPPLTDDTFGGAVRKLIEVAGIYHKCRAAAIGEPK